mgnify:CR=1 FL=1
MCPVITLSANDASSAQQELERVLDEDAPAVALVFGADPDANACRSTAQSVVSGSQACKDVQLVYVPEPALLDTARVAAWRGSPLARVVFLSRKPRKVSHRLDTEAGKDIGDVFNAMLHALANRDPA